MEIVHISSKGQLVIPESIRKKYRIKKGSRFILIEEAKRLVLEDEASFSKRIKHIQPKEDLGWLALAEKSLQSLWENEKDEKIWKEYL